MKKDGYKIVSEGIGKAAIIGAAIYSPIRAAYSGFTYDQYIHDLKIAIKNEVKPKKKAIYQKKLQRTLAGGRKAYIARSAASGAALGAGFGAMGHKIAKAHKAGIGAPGYKPGL